MTKNAEYQARYKELHPEKLAVRHRVANLKYSRAHPRQSGQWARDHRDRAREIARDSARRSRILLRSEMLSAYGGQCSCCGESNEIFLTLDHSDGSGADHRRAVGRNRVLRDLQLRGWPSDGFRILCMNCNWATRYGEVCPHALD